MSEKQWVCPKCNSKEYEIEQGFILGKRQYEYTVRCLHCNYRITSLGNFQKSNRECR